VGLWPRAEESALIDALYAVAAGIGLSTACGFRVCAPLLAMALGAHVGLIHPSEHFSWIGSSTSIVMLAVATVAEMCAYYLPLIDIALDAITSPAAVIAGFATTFIAISGVNIPPDVRWALILTAGSAAGAVQLGTVSLRATSTLATASLGNRFVTKFENLAATILAMIALLAPVLGTIIAIALLSFIIGFAWQRRQFTFHESH
jgi:Domain of unknown function (DUF4126)